MDGWPSQSIFDHNYQYVTLPTEAFEFFARPATMPRARPPVADLLNATTATLNQVREMLAAAAGSVTFATTFNLNSENNHRISLHGFVIKYYCRDNDHPRSVYRPNCPGAKD